MKEKEISQKSKSSKMNFTLKSEKTSYNFNLIDKEGELTFKFQNLNEFPIKIYELKIDFEKLKQYDENFDVFTNSVRLTKTIKASIDTNNYSVSFNEEENLVIFEIKNIIFDDGVAKLKVPEKEQDLETKVESLTKIVSELRKEMQNIKIKDKDKDEAAIKSFAQTAILKDDEEKKMISRWIHPNKIIRFNLLFATNIDGDRSVNFHYNCDGFFPTVTVIQDTSNRKFGGYSTQNWCPSPCGGAYSRAPESFIFNLTNKQKFELNDPFHKNAIYRNTSYGPMFGQYEIYIADQCKSTNNSYCTKNNTYNTGNVNILGGNGQTNFTVSIYEVYQVIFE